MLVGLPNRIMNQLCAEIMQNQDFVKMVYYKDNNEDVLALPDLENSHKLLKNKQVFINRKIPKILHDFDVNVFMTLSRWRSYTPFKKNASQSVDEVTIKVVVLVQESCLITENGNRDIAILSIIKNIVEKSDLNGIGNCSVEDIAEVYALPPEFHGFEMYIKVYGHKQLKVEI